MIKYPKMIFYTLLIFSISAISLNAQVNTEDDGKTGYNYPSFQLSMSFNMGYAHNPDMDKWTDNNGDMLAEAYNTFVGADDFSGDTSTGNFTYGIDAEIRFFRDSSGFGLGTGYNMAQSETEVSSSRWADKGKFSLTLGVVPFTGTVYYRTAVSDRSFLLFGAGAGYYLASMKAEYKDEDSIPGDSGYEYDFNTSAIGYHVKCEYNLLIDNFFLSSGILARYVQFDKFEDNGLTIVLDGSNLEAGLTGAVVYLSAGIAI